MDLPKKGEIVPLEEIVSLCWNKHRLELMRRIENNPPDSPFSSDGCSMFPDVVAAVDIYEDCFFHDLEYWCGGTDVDRLVADAKLLIGVAKKGIPNVALAMFAAVRAGGTDELETLWRWGFGRL